MEVLNKFIERLTDNYNKDPQSNIYKLLQVASKHMQENEDLLKQIEKWRDIDQAEGQTLNNIGKNVQQNRGQAPDNVYRVLIKSKIKRNLSNGSINTLIDFLAFTLQIEAQEVIITELWNQGEHASIHVNVPIDSVSKTGLTFNQFGTLINLVIAAGVKANVLFEGTFGFSATYDQPETLNAHGFADVDRTTGGTFGASYDPAEDYELPY